MSNRLCPAPQAKRPWWLPGAALALLLSPATGRGGPLVLEPAWGGAYAAGRPTEVEIALVSPVGGRVLIEAGLGETEVRADLPVEAGRPARLTLPLNPGPGGTLRVTARLPDGTQVGETAEFRRLAGGPAPAGATETAPAGPAEITSGSSLALTTAPDGLPRHPWGYGPVAELTLDAADLRRLDPAQTAALGAYLAECRPLHLRDAGAALLTAVRGAAGCFGRAVGAVDGQNPPAPIAPSAAPWPAPGQPPAPVPKTGVLSAWALLFLPYPLLLLALAWRPRASAWLLALPPAAALAYGLALPMAAGGPRVSVWSEMDAGDPSLRYVALIELPGRSGAGPDLPLPGALEMVPLDHAKGGAGVAVTRLTLAPDGGLSLAPPDNLFQQRGYRVRGTAPAPFSVTLAQADPAGGLSLANLGPTAIPGAWLLWHGAAHPVAPLAPGERRRVDVAAAAVPPPGPPPLTAEAGAGPALLVPGISPLPGATPGSDAWLLIHAGEQRP